MVQVHAKYIIYTDNGIYSNVEWHQNLFKMGYIYEDFIFVLNRAENFFTFSFFFIEYQRVELCLVGL